jgi:antitoxin ParD1/3/4
MKSKHLDIALQHYARAKLLRRALIAGEQSGEPRPFDKSAFLKRMQKKHGGC